MSEELAYADHNIAEIARLRRLLDLAHAENATLRDAYAAALAWLEARGADLPKLWRDELKEALHGH